MKHAITKERALFVSAWTHFKFKALSFSSWSSCMVSVLCHYRQTFHLQWLSAHQSLILTNCLQNPLHCYGNHHRRLLSASCVFTTSAEGVHIVVMPWLDGLLVRHKEPWPGPMRMLGVIIINCQPRWVQKKTLFVLDFQYPWSVWLCFQCSCSQFASLWPTSGLVLRSLYIFNMNWEIVREQCNAHFT